MITDGEDDYAEDAAFDEVIDNTDLSVNIIPDASSDLEVAILADSDLNTDVTDFEDDANFDEIIGEEERDDGEDDYLEDANFDEVKLISS